jgi:type III secretory pathway lipoprotein EscJ
MLLKKAVILNQHGLISSKCTEESRNFKSALIDQEQFTEERAVTLTNQHGLIRRKYTE